MFFLSNSLPFLLEYKNIIFYICLISLLKCSTINNISYIRIPFYPKYDNKSSLSSFYYNDIYSKITIGSNNQQIELKIQLNSFPLYLSDKKSVSQNFIPYIPQNSITYNSLSKLLFYDIDFMSGTVSTENFEINSTKINLKFILAEQMSYSATIIPPGSIGFGISPPSSYREKNINFIEQLKRNNVISDYSASFLFNKDDGGEIIIGEDLDRINNKFSLDKIIIKSGTNDKQLDWGFNFKEIELINNSTNMSCYCNDNALLDFSHEYIISSIAFSYSIQNIFFNDLIKEKKCFIEEIKNSNYYNYLYRIIKCENTESINNFIINNFPLIRFTIKDINSLALNFTYEDLFFIKDDYIYFKMILYYFENENDYNINIELCKRNQWVFGKIFFKKYNITLNKDKKIIAFYFDHNNENGEINIKNKYENRNKTRLLIIIWILVLFIFILGFILFHFIRKNFLLQNKIYNKNRKNILVNEMEYFPNYDE